MVEKDVISYLVDAETGKVAAEFQAGDKLKVVKESQAQYCAEHSPNWGDGRPFVKVYTDIIPYMRKELSKTEFSAVFLLLPYTSYEDCIIRADGTTRNSKMLDLSEICDAIGEKYDNGRRIIRSLHLKGVLGRFSTYVVFGEDVKEKEVYFMNPYLLFKGNDILLTVLQLFQDSIWHKYYEEIDKDKD